MSKQTVACRATVVFTFAGPVWEHVLDLLYLRAILFWSSICGGLWPTVGGRIVHCGRNSCFCCATQNEFDGGRRQAEFGNRCSGVTSISRACGPSNLLRPGIGQCGGHKLLPPAGCSAEPISPMGTCRPILLAKLITLHRRRRAKAAVTKHF